MLYSQIILLIPHFFVKFSLFSVRVHCYRACEKLNSGHALKVIHVLASKLLVTGAFGPVRLTEKRPTYFLFPVTVSTLYGLLRFPGWQAPRPSTRGSFRVLLSCDFSRLHQMEGLLAD